MDTILSAVLLLFNFGSNKHCEFVASLGRTKTNFPAYGSKTVMLSLCILDGIVVAMQRHRVAVCRGRARVFSRESL